MEDHTDFFINNCLIKKSQVVIAEQTHSDNVHVCSMLDSGAGFDEHSQILNCDALITVNSNQYLMIRTADCTPILIWDIYNHVIAAVHSGRVGTQKNLIGKTIKILISKFKSNPCNLKVHIGPGICKDHYPVSESIYEDFILSCKLMDVDTSNFSPTYIDIHSIIYQQITKMGINNSNIFIDKTCTYDSKSYYSFRRDGTKNRQINLIGMRNGKHYL